MIEHQKHTHSWSFRLGYGAQFVDRHAQRIQTARQQHLFIAHGHDDHHIFDPRSFDARRTGHGTSPSR
ncbi:hypothetical protein [Cryobacterium sp. Y82]|uniref:hypothetical protein n=1 Tax=Cryobacterium sp. Y82 TaxID=2045017 RepID=UPI000CE4390A|nr:hypothetical protein [Cryobacterium sp. Y82]